MTVFGVGAVAKVWPQGPGLGVVNIHIPGWTTEPMIRAHESNA